MSTQPSTSLTDQSDTSETQDKAPTSVSESGASFGGWFSNIVQSAKDTVNKSAGTLESIKRDLSEFKDAVQNDATSMVYSTASIVKNKLNEIGNTVNEIGSLGTDELEPENQQSFDEDNRLQKEQTTSSINEDDNSPSFNMETINSWTNMLTDTAKSTLNMVKETLAESIFINREFLIDEINEEPYVLKDGQIIPIENWKSLLHSLQVNPDTYCREPNGSPEEFDIWLTKFNLMNYQKQMEYLLENVPEIKKMHLNLVPKELSDSDFWHRYYYKVHQLKEEQTRLILLSDQSPASPDAEENKPSSSVNIKYLSEKSSAAESREESESKISRSSTEDWEKMNDSDHVITKEGDKCSSDESTDWVRCD